MRKYRKKQLIELVNITGEGYLVQNEGQPNDRWIIPPSVFEKTYEETDVEAENLPQMVDPTILFEALKVTDSTDCYDIEFREKIKAKLSILLDL